MAEFLVLLLLQVTIFSSVAAALIIAVKQIFKCRIPPAIGIFMWAVLLARLLCPIYPESRVSIYNFVPVGRSIMFSLTYNIDAEMDALEEERFKEENPYVIKTAAPEDTTSRSEEDAASGTALSDAVAEDDGKRTEKLVDAVILSVYVLGIVLFLWRQIYVYCRAKKEAYFQSRLCSDRELLTIYYSTAFSLGLRASKIPELRVGNTSMLAGCFRPSVICRQGSSPAEARMVFTHELNHYINHDNPLLLFSTGVCCMFWYNPLMWIVRNMLREDIELLCDARTLESCGMESVEYAMMLCRHSAFGELSLAQGGAGMSATGRRLKTRLKNISIMKKHNYLSRSASVLLCVAIVAVCLTNPVISQNSEYSEYIKNYAELTGVSEREIYLDGNMTPHKFLTQVSELLRERGGESLSAKMGNGNLTLLKRMAENSDDIPADVSKALSGMKNDETLTLKGCAVLVKCITELLSDGKTGVESDVPLLPVMIRAEDFERTLSALTPEAAEQLSSCYNRGVRGADVAFDYLYTDAMMELISARINDEWMRSKLQGYYSEVNVRPEDLDSVSDRIDAIIRYVGSGKNFFICDPRLTDYEKNLLREIIGAATAGEREDVYYLKEREDGFSFKEAERLFAEAGYTTAQTFAGYASLGASLYDYISPDERSLTLSESEFRNMEKRASASALADSLYEIFEYHENVPVEGREISNDSGYYTLNLENTENGEQIFAELVAEMNALYFPKLYTIDRLTIVGIADDGVREAVIEGVELGILSAEDDSLYLSDRISCGESLRIAYRLRACMVNETTTRP